MKLKLLFYIWNLVFLSLKYQRKLRTNIYLWDNILYFTPNNYQMKVCQHLDKKKKTLITWELTEPWKVSYDCVNCSIFTWECVMIPGDFEFTFESLESSEIYPQRQIIIR